ncbi:MAG: polymerase/histidinol phosphatase-like protein [Olpidium bornovanus]|uniref:histidinol-phosphatase n=1 Tax=Olpidium bornovanus TaxID=278681 RepID=A0A8H7ZWY3_9FUNG|nr:MAG: polymerase/histidinol phosphatase-like protein [Olpidium bornovanus]
MPISLHSHSGQFCRHAAGTLEEVVRSASRRGFLCFGLTEHIPRLRDCDLYPEEAERLGPGHNGPLTRLSGGGGVPAQLRLSPRDLDETFLQFVREARRLQRENGGIAKAEDDGGDANAGGSSPETAGTMTLLVGFETEFVNEESLDYVLELRERHSPDYIVGSVHHVNEIPIDFSQDLYDRAATFATLRRTGTGCRGKSHALTPQHLEALFEDYFDAQYSMLQKLRPEIVGHFDLIRLFEGRPETSTGANLADRPTLGLLKDYPKIWAKVTRNVDFVVGYEGLFEVNAKAYKKGLCHAYPCDEILQYIKSMGGLFTLSDDSHGPDEVGLNYARMFVYLRNAGVQYVHSLVRRPDRDRDHQESATAGGVFRASKVAVVRHSLPALADLWAAKCGGAGEGKAPRP